MTAFFQISYRRIFAIVLVFLCVSASLRLENPAQVRPVYDRGAMGLVQVLKSLNTSASAMMIGAHPDDEDTALLAYLSRGENARTAYLSLTRGDGGQNIIGSELGEALGVIRTEELLQARELDGAEQYFTRAYDYGFSKTLAEAREKWDEQGVLCDTVKAIRDFRPLVIISQFSGTPADGHGHHQFAGYITPLAIKAASDPEQCRGAGNPWTVKKFYVRHGFRATGEPRLRINTGRYDPLLGRSYFEIAMEARSQHKSQEQGVLELKGETFSGLNRADSDAEETGLFYGLDISITGIAGSTNNSEPGFTEHLHRLQKLAASALDEYDVRSPEKILPVLTEGYRAAYDAEWSTRRPASKAFLRQKQKEYLEAIKLAAGIQIDVLSETETVAPGETTGVSARVFFPAGSVNVKNITLNAPTGWQVSPAEPPTGPQTGFFRRENPRSAAYFRLTVPDNAEPTQPYWLRRPRQGDMFQVDPGVNQTLPFAEPSVYAEITIESGGQELKFRQPVEYRFADDIRGEIRRPLAVVPRLSLALDQDLIVVGRAEGPLERKMSVTITSNSAERLSGDATLTPPRGGTSKPNGGGFILSRKGESSTIPFTIDLGPNAPAGSSQVNAQATANEKREFSSMRTIAYPHIQTHRIYGAATARFIVLDVKTAPVNVGYIAGSGDRVPEALQQLGVNVSTIDTSELSSGDLSKYDTIVVGIRAYQVRPDLVANNKRLVDFMNAGGTLVVQYQLSAYGQQNLAPYPAQQGPRTSDETAPVNILSPGHALLSFPNKITAADFENWVQERNLYNFAAMDPRYTGLLETHDPGEAENRGGLVVADVGRGKFVYCSYSLFRQLPAGVPGAYRLLANMISLPKAP